ncbi:hypothetical protein KUV80_13925 [Fictibacillus nanhaiensis]|uniref:hypothetical protein n=1 Tax=Fictibacillus nanhaiensis TaxID=742169 RepID=UPI001C9546C2|nr:hypothetical protein [Fictibacillus nanhaiensis]MBY6037765.1 hypothetical protein [Fictibacillus nanhaiensis]
MKRRLTGMLFLLFLFGCSSVSPELENLMKEQPTIEKEMKTLPDTELSQIKLPSYLPFQPDTISSSVEKDAGFRPQFTEVTYQKKGNAILHITTYFNKVEKIDPDMPTTVKLKDGTLADMRRNSVNTKEMVWSNNEQKITYKITLAVIPKTNNPWTKEDLLKMAESMK